MVSRLAERLVKALIRKAMKLQKHLLRVCVTKGDIRSRITWIAKLLKLGLGSLRGLAKSSSVAKVLREEFRRRTVVKLLRVELRRSAPVLLLTPPRINLVSRDSPITCQRRPFF